MNKGIPPLFLERLRQIVPDPFWEQGNFSFLPKRNASFRINTLKVKIPHIHAQLRDQGLTIETVPWYAPAFLVPQEQREALLNLPLAQEGQIYAQGLQSMVPVVVLDPKPGMRVLDLCAAPGSKTSQIAAHMNNEGYLAANEFIRTRFFRLKSVLELTAAKAQLSSIDGRRYEAREGVFDQVLIDAPCSSEGRFNALEPKSVGFWSKRKIEEMAHKQKGLLANAARLVGTGGTLLYSTCTFAPEENEEVVDWFLRKNEGSFQVEEIQLPGIPSYPAMLSWGKRSYDPQVSQCLRILPTDSMEGFFIAKLRKLA